MASCFVIQPFDSGKYEKRFDDIYSPAIKAAGLEAYRVDRDPGVSIPIDSIEEGIKRAAICLADITTDNPNVWYELGYAFAIDCPVVMICSNERPDKKYPFDIQHRTIIPYSSDAPSDFDRLRQKITSHLKALIEKGAMLRKVAEADPVASIQGLGQTEIKVIAVIAGSCTLPSDAISAYSLKRDAEAAGVTNMGFNLAVRRLTSKGFIETGQRSDNQSYGEYDVINITEDGWAWVDKNESLFVLLRQEPEESGDDLPF